MGLVPQSCCAVCMYLDGLTKQVGFELFFFPSFQFRTISHYFLLTLLTKTFNESINGN